MLKIVLVAVLTATSASDDAHLKMTWEFPTMEDCQASLPVIKEGLEYRAHLHFIDCLEEKEA